MIHWLNLNKDDSLGEPKQRWFIGWTKTKMIHWVNQNKDDALAEPKQRWIIGWTKTKIHWLNLNKEDSSGEPKQRFIRWTQTQMIHCWTQTMIHLERNMRSFQLYYQTQPHLADTTTLYCLLSHEFTTNLIKSFQLFYICWPAML